MASAASALAVENGFPRSGIAGSRAAALGGERERETQRDDQHRRNHSALV